MILAFKESRNWPQARPGPGQARPGPGQGLKGKAEQGQGQKDTRPAIRDGQGGHEGQQVHKEHQDRGQERHGHGCQSWYVTWSEDYVLSMVSKLHIFP